MILSAQCFGIDTISIILAVHSIKELYVNLKCISKPCFFCLKLCKTKILILIFFLTSMNISRHCADWFFITKSFSVDPFKIYHFNLKYNIIREFSRNSKLPLMIPLLQFDLRPEQRMHVSYNVDIRELILAIRL